MFKRTKGGITFGGIEYSLDITAIVLLWIAFSMFETVVSQTIGSTWYTGPVAMLMGLGLIISLLLHEMGHAYTSIALGIPIKGIRLFALGGMAIMERRPSSARQEFWIAIAGPLVSVVLWWILIGPVALGNEATWAVLLGKLGFYNLAIAIFNMIPAFPTDGGRVFRAILWAIFKKPVPATTIAVRVAELIAAAYSLFAIINISSYGYGVLWPLLLSAFIVYAAESELKHTKKEVEDGQTEG